MRGFGLLAPVGCAWAVMLACSQPGTSNVNNPATGCPPACAPIAGSDGAAGGLAGAAAGTSAAAGESGEAGTGTPSTSGAGGVSGMSAAGTTGDAGGTAGDAAGTSGDEAGAGAGESGAGGAAGTGAGTAGTGGMVQTLPPVTSYTQRGPFRTTMQANTGPSNNYTMWRPDPLGENGFLHSPVIFGPGILTSPSLYNTLLTHLASHGFVILCVNSLTGGPNAPGNLTAMRTGLDWLIAQNSAAGVFQGKLAVGRAVTMGYSIGSTASVQLSSHEAILTTIGIHGHNTSGDPRGPVLLLTGTDDVIGDVRRTLTTLDEAPAMMAALPIGHLNVLTELGANGRYLGPITAWLRYWVNGDDDAKRFFWGTGCEMCSSPFITPETNAAWKAQNL
jgi:hypothetical protein